MTIEQDGEVCIIHGEELCECGEDTKRKHWPVGKMRQMFEIWNWHSRTRIQLCDTKETAVKILPYHDHGKNHVIREIWFHSDGTIARIIKNKPNYRQLQIKE